MKTKLMAIFSLLALGIIMAACQTANQTGDANEYTGLIGNLRSNGAQVSQNGEIVQEFFAVNGKSVKVNGNDIQVFEYSSEQDANEDASKVSADGSSVGTSMIMWIDSPHFYKKGKLIVLYLGKNAEVNRLLEASLGNQFAGASWEMFSKTMATRAGDLTLRYENNQAVLSGTLQRSTPCVNWTVQAISTKDFPISSVSISIFDSDKGAICIQVLGEPQEIKEIITQVSENTKYTVKFEGEELFSGKLEEK